MQKHPYYLNLLQEDLKLLAAENYREGKIKWEAKIKLLLIHLLLEEKLYLQKLEIKNEAFCLAYDHFNAHKTSNLLALIFLGFGLINAYKGNKHPMLQGFNLAVDYDSDLENLSRFLIRQLPFYMESLTDSEDLLANPLKQLHSIDSSNPLTIKPKLQ